MGDANFLLATPKTPVTSMLWIFLHTRSRGTSYCLFLISITITTRYAQYYVGQWHYLACSKYFRKETRGLFHTKYNQGFFLGGGGGAFAPP